MSDGPPEGWDFAWWLSIFGMPMTVLVGMMGWMVHHSHLNRVADCRAAFGPEATPLQDVEGGTLCHVGEGVNIAPATESVPVMGAFQSFLYSWPLWAYGVVALIVTVFITGAIIKAARRVFGGSHA